MCVCEREKERERKCVCVCVSVFVWLIVYFCCFLCRMGVLSICSFSLTLRRVLYTNVHSWHDGVHTENHKYLEYYRLITAKFKTQLKTHLILIINNQCICNCLAYDIDTITLFKSILVCSMSFVKV